MFIAVDRSVTCFKLISLAEKPMVRSTYRADGDFAKFPTFAIRIHGTNNTAPRLNLAPALHLTRSQNLLSPLSDTLYLH